ncbi:MAG TPA: flagellar hook-basal body complex protein FliE [Candidatus Dormibacteraeota bacterium]|nr:flagellar hook-basal body complex protein FliE [Candidatus Dormibacteraeota bacterium]
MNLPSFSDAIRAVKPDTFVPDLPVGAGAGLPAGVAGTEPVPQNQPSFKETLGQVLNDVNTRMETANANVRDYAEGKTKDVVKVTTSVEEASLAFQFTLAIQNKLISAYQSIENMQL